MLLENVSGPDSGESVSRRKLLRGMGAAIGAAVLAPRVVWIRWHYHRWKQTRMAPAQRRQETRAPSMEQQNCRIDCRSRLKVHA